MNHQLSQVVVESTLSLADFLSGIGVGLGIWALVVMFRPRKSS